MHFLCQRESGYESEIKRVDVIYHTYGDVYICIAVMCGDVYICIAVMQMYFLVISFHNNTTINTIVQQC